MVNDLINQVIKVVNKFNQLEKKPVDFGTGETLYPSEIHLIEAIGKTPEQTVTELCGRLGVTKGAVSQVVTKLYRKGYVEKVRNQAYGKEILLSLSEKGEKAYRAHEDLHQRMDEEIAQLLGTRSESELRQFSEMLVQVEKHIDRYIAMK